VCVGLNSNSDAAFVSAVLRLRLGRLWRFGYGGCDSTDPRCDYATVDCDHVDGFWRFGCGFCFGGTATDTDDDNGFMTTDCFDNDHEEARLRWQVAQVPAPILHPSEGARLTAGTSTYVGTMYTGTTDYDPSQLPPELRGTGGRGKDRRQKSGRRCKRCLKYNDEQNASECKGRGGENKCKYYDVNGNKINNA